MQSSLAYSVAYFNKGIIKLAVKEYYFSNNHQQIAAFPQSIENMPSAKDIL